MQGTRLPDARIDEPGGGWDSWRRDGKMVAPPGSYMKVTLPGGKVTWYMVDPLGHVGSIGGRHSVEEHDDGTITVTPSLLDESDGGWHGWLRAGVWMAA